MRIITYRMYIYAYVPWADTRSKMAHEDQPTNTFTGGTFCSSAPHSGIALLEGMLLHGTSERACISDLHSCPQL